MIRSALMKVMAQKLATFHSNEERFAYMDGLADALKCEVAERESQIAELDRLCTEALQDYEKRS